MKNLNTYNNSFAPMYGAGYPDADCIGMELVCLNIHI